jgi:hypothetical protein
MLPTKLIERFIEARDLPGLRIAFAKLCASTGEAELIEVFLYGSYGNFSAFCTAKMKTRAAEETLLKRYGFQQLGDRVYLPRTLAPEFERRALARAA